MLNMRRLAKIVPQVTSVAFGFRQCSYVITVGYFDPLLWAVRVTTFVETFCIGCKYNFYICIVLDMVDLYGGASSLNAILSELQAFFWFDLERKVMHFNCQ